MPHPSADAVPVAVERGPLRSLDNGFFGPDSVSWRVWTSPTSLIGFQRAVVLEHFDPPLAAAVADSGGIYDDPHGRLDQTLAYFLTVAVGDSRTVVQAAEFLMRIHAQATGIDPVTGRRYSANSPESQLWIHLTGWHSVLKAYELYGPGRLSKADEDRYWAECAVAAELHPHRVGLLAPVEERGFAPIQTDLRVECVLPVLRERVLQRLVGLVGERLVVKQAARAEEPDDAVGRDRPAAAGARVLHDVESLRCRRLAHVGQLELKRAPRARRIEPAEREVDRIGRIARPHERPFHPGDEAVAGNRLAVIVLPLSHDEVVHGKGALLSKMPGDPWQKYANLRLLLAYQWATPGKKLLFMGGEIGVWNEWNHDHQLDWAVGQHAAHSGLARLVGDLNRVYRAHRALHARDCDPVGFQWLVGDDRDASVFAFLRTGEEGDPPVLCAMNATPVPREGYRLGVPRGGYWKEILNSDAGVYFGSGMGNHGGVHAENVWCRGKDQSIVITIPPLALVMFVAT